MQHPYHAGDDVQTLGGNVEKHVEGGYELRADILARVANDVVKRPSDDAFLVLRP